MLTKISQFLSSKLGMRLLSFLLALTSILSVTVLYYSQNSFFEAFEAKTYDLRFQSMRGALPPNPDIAIIAIDDKSIRELGRYPWKRTEYANLINELSKIGTKAILFDAFFPEPENANADRQFAAAVKHAGNVILATNFEFDAEFNIKGQTGSIAELENAAAGVGHINFLPENDGVNRRSLLIINDKKGITPSLGLQAAMLALGETKLVPSPFYVALGDRQIPTNANNAMWINFMGPPGVYPRYSFVDVAKGRIDPNLLKGKILFVGATALGVYDMRVTPFHGNTPGVEVHATIADNIISGRFVQQAGLEALLDILFIILLGGGTYFLTTRLRLYIALPTTLLIIASYIAVCYQFFVSGHWVSMVYPPLAALTALLLGASFRFLVLERSARKMRAMFSSYLSDKLVARLEKDPDAAKLGGDTKEVTVLFTDIKSFTTFSEGHTPQEVVARLNEYLGEMVQLVEQFDGTVDKFIGDGIMVYWGAPLSQPNHAQLAIECIHAMRDKMIQLRQRWEREGAEPFYIRGGLQSGLVVAGNVGFEGKKMEYTVIGDTVNQAARFEGTAKFYGIEYLVGNATFEQTQHLFTYREIDQIRVVGKHLPVRVYEPIGFSNGINEACAAEFNQALALYRSQQWHLALESFTQLSLKLPDDKPCKMYIDRCQFFENTPPAGQWDGVFNRREK
jgi:adenylate cyclase